MAVATARPNTTPEGVLRTLIGKFPPKDQTLIRAVRAAIKKRLPTANEMVYDYSGKLVLSYTPTEHGKDGVLSTAMDGGGMRLYFGGGPQLPDPKKLLQGSGGARYIVVESATRLAHPDVKALITAAVAQSKFPLPATGKGQVLDRSADQKKRAGKKPK